MYRYTKLLSKEKFQMYIYLNIINGKVSDVDLLKYYQWKSFRCIDIPNYYQRKVSDVYILKHYQWKSFRCRYTQILSMEKLQMYLHTQIVSMENFQMYGHT